MRVDGAGDEAEGACASDKAKGVGASDDNGHASLMGRLTTVDDVGVGDKADHTASTELMSAIRLEVPILAMRFSVCR